MRTVNCCRRRIVIRGWVWWVPDRWGLRDEVRPCTRTQPLNGTPPYPTSASPDELPADGTLPPGGACSCRSAHSTLPASSVDQIIAGRPVPDDIHTSVGAIVAARIRAASAPELDHPRSGLRRAGHRPALHPPHTVGEALTYRALTEYAGCGRPDEPTDKTSARPASTGPCAAPAPVPPADALIPTETDAAPPAPPQEGPTTP